MSGDRLTVGPGAARVTVAAGDGSMRSRPASAASILAGCVRLSRWNEWAQSKLPYVASVALLLDVPAAHVPLVVAAVAAWAAFGYAVNELADRDQDDRAVRRNRAAPLPAWACRAFVILAASSALGLSMLWATGPATPAVVAAGLALAAAYSVRPVRLKERGALGLAAAALAQWVFPVLAVSAAAPGSWADSAALSLALLSLALGLRWILVHQLEDARGDRRAGVRTYASSRGDVSAMLVAGFVLELGSLAAALALTWPRSIPALATLLVWGVGWERPSSRRHSLPRRLATYDDAPLAPYYFFILPPVLALSALTTPAASALLAVAVLALGLRFLGGSLHSPGARGRTRPHAV
jgi:4-hydroxybenzoate polyprenyltransferase